MSLFKTSVPVDLESIKNLLPKDHSIDAVKFNAETCSVELHWHARYVETGYTFAVDWPVKLLESKEIPPGSKFTQPQPDLKPAEPKKAKNRTVRAK